MAHAVTPTSSGVVACLLTPPGAGGISLIQLSGPNCAAILGALFHGRRGLRPVDASPGRLLYGHLRRQGVELDEVIVECAGTTDARRYVINCHGGAVAARRVMAALTAGGAREVPWRDAAHNPGIDALRREAATLLPSAPTLRGVQMLLDQYRGALSSALHAARQKAEGGEVNAARDLLSGLLATAPWGRGLIEPASLALIGRPNVGKSTLANALLRYERMIVHPDPGTTRDAVEELLAVRDIPFRLLDTAGIRETGHEIEREGVALSVEVLSRADVVLLLFDASAPLTAEDLGLLASRARGRILVLNKCDLPARLDAAELTARTGETPVSVSAATGAGLGALEDRIVAVAYPRIPDAGTAVVFTERQERCLTDALNACEKSDVPTLLQAIYRAIDGNHGSPR